MKLKTIIISLLVIALIGYLLALSYKKSASTTASVQGVENTGAKSLLTATEAFFDFGKISMKDGNTSTEFIVTNTSEKNITIKTLVTSCMCTVAFIIDSEGKTKGPFGMPGHGGAVPPANETVNAGESRKIRAVYDPNAHGPAGVGVINRFITLTDDSGGILQFEIKANVTP
jgi:hypothetical protein